MIVAMYYHLFPNATEAAGVRCSCAFRTHAMA